jgi:hypothetical protein
MSHEYVSNRPGCHLFFSDTSGWAVAKLAIAGIIAASGAEPANL